MLNDFRAWLFYKKIVPEHVRMKLREKNHGSHFPKQYKEMNAIYIHIPKTAGTSISGNIFGINDLGHAHYALTDYFWEDKTFSENAFKFAFVRNPWDRLFSAYSHLISPTITVGPRTQSVSNFINKNSVDFNSFVKLLDEKEWLREWVHFIPQSSFISIENRIAVDFIGRFEALDNDLKIIAEKLNLALPELQHVNKSKKRTSQYQDIYTSYSKDFVSDFYRNDIDEFDYKF